MSQLRLLYGGITGGTQSMDWALKVILDYYKVTGVEKLPPRVANAIDSLLEMS